MTLGRKTGGRDWKPGQSGNPNGRPPMPKEVREAMNMNKILFAELLTKYLGKTLEELVETQKAKDTAALDRIVISVITNAIKKGDDKRLDFLMTRIIGKAESKIDITTGGEKIQNQFDLSKLTRQELKSLNELSDKWSME